MRSASDRKTSSLEKEKQASLGKMNQNINIIKSKRGTVSIRVTGGGSLEVRAPKYMANAEIMRFVEKHKGWIEKRRAVIQRENQAVNQLGRLTEQEIKELAKKALEDIPPRVAYYAEKIGVTYGRITIRNQKTRWGSCSSKGNLNFNCLLMLTPEQVRDSIVVHELCHRKYMDHSQHFYELVREVYPEYDRWNRWLKKNGGVILKRML